MSGPSTLVRRALVVVGLWLLLVLGFTLLAAWDLRAAKLAAAELRAAGADELRDEAAATPLRLVRQRSSRAETVLGLPLFLPLRPLPVVGRQLASVRALAGAVGEVAGVGLTLREAALPLLEGGPEGGADRVRKLRTIDRALVAAATRLEGIELGPDDALVAPLHDARGDVAEEIGETTRTLGRAASVVRTLATMLDGPQRYLLLVCNNAEMRSGSGMPLSVGTVDTAGGDLRLGDLVPAADLRLDTPIDVPGDLGERWGFADPGREWRSLGMSPRFDATAGLAARLWEARTGGQVDGVLAVDIAALRFIVDATGPVTAGDRKLEGKALRDFLMHDQYEDFEAVRFGDQRRRREVLSEVARSLVERIQKGEGDRAALAAALAEAAAGRHLLAWARDAEAQAGWEAAGVAGRVASMSLLPALVNRGETKLDHFIRLRHELRIMTRRDGRSVTVRTEIENRTPGGEPDYVVGPVPGLTNAPGDYLGLLAATVPGAATAIEIWRDGAPCPPSAAGADGPTRIAACPVLVPPGTTVVITTAFALPAGTGPIVVEPSARVPSALWRHGARTFDDGTTTVIG